MIKVFVFLIIFVSILLIISLVIIKKQNEQIQKYKNDTAYYRNAVIEANNRINSLYKQIEGLQKIDDWKHTENQKPEEDVIADIININNNRVQNH